MKSIISVREINNSSILREGFIINEDARLDNLIKEAAQKVLDEREEKPIVLLAGPSGSGKTTTAFKMGEYLNEKGVTAHIISMDNYFSENCNLSNDLDLEKPERVDIEFLQNDLERLLIGETINVPKFDFKTQSRSFPGEKLELSDKSILILEGIHVLNPAVVGDTLKHASGIYVSVRTRISKGELILHPKNIRLLRRALRDTKYRGLSLPEVIEKSQHVNTGEDLYIMPYKNNANIQINTFASYEVPILKYYLYRKLTALGYDYLEKQGLSDLMAILESIDEIDDVSCVQPSAILREFIGKSKFTY